MIEIKSNYKNGHIGGSVVIKGDKSIVVEELACLFNQIAERDELLMVEALDKYLDLRGFPQRLHDEV